MKKFISLAVALAMILSAVPMLAFAADATTETFTLFDAAADIDEGDYHGDVALKGYGWTSADSGVVLSTQWSAAGTWNEEPWGAPALMFFRSAGPQQGTDETKRADLDNAALTEGASKITIEFNFAMQTDNDNYQYWYFKDLDGNTFAQLHYDKNGPCDAGIDNPTVYAEQNLSAAAAVRGTNMKIEAAKNESGKWTVTYSRSGEVIHTDEVASVNGFKGIEAVVKEWCKQYKAMALMGLKVSMEQDPSKVAKVTVKTVLSDGEKSGVADRQIIAAPGSFTPSVPKKSVIEANNNYYYLKKIETVNIEAGKENVVELMYEKYTGEGSPMSEIADGATCWFADPRTLTVTSEGKDITYVGYIDNVGNVRATQYDNETGDYEEVLVRSNLQPDDHNNPAFLELPDHHILIIYSRHTDENCFYYRVSKEPYDITTLGEEKRLVTADPTTYPNPFILSDDPTHIYMGWRGVEWHPTFARIKMPTEQNGYTMEFDWEPHQIVRSDIQQSGCRPYAKYASDGKNKVWITYTGTHPDNVPTNPIYCNYIDITDLTLHDAKGALLQNLNEGRYTVSGSESETETQVVYRENNVRGWVWEIALDENNYPVIAMVKIDSSKQKHDYWLAHFDGEAWQRTDLPDPTDNTYFHETTGVEQCYSGGMSIDKANTHVVYASVPISGANGKVWEIVKYTLSDDYSCVESAEYITKDSEKNNARPYVAYGSKEGDLRLTWFNGDYYYWIHSSEHGGHGYPVKMMTLTELKKPEIVNVFDTVDNKEYKVNATEKAEIPVTGDGSFTFSVTFEQDNIAEKGTLLESGNLEITLEDQTVDNTYTYAAVAPKITVGDKTEKSQNLFSDSAWYLTLSGTKGGKGQSSLGNIIYTVSYDKTTDELVTYVNGLIDATMQNAGVKLGDKISICGISATVRSIAFSKSVLTQAEVRSAANTAALDSITLPKETLTDIILPATVSGSSVVWSSNAPEIMDETGAVTRDGEAHNVTLTASVGTDSKDFIVKVLPKENIMDENLVLFYDFNNVTDTTVPDLSSNGYDAELKGSRAKLDGGKLDLTANVANTNNNTDAGADNGYLNVPYNFYEGKIRSYTVIQQISGGTASSNPRLYDFGSATDRSMFTRLNATGYDAGIKNPTTLMTSGGSHPDGEYWLITVYSAATGKTMVYTISADGELVQQNADNTSGIVTYEPYQIPGATTRNYIGRAQWNNDSGQRAGNIDFNGTIDNFMFFDAALTADELKTVTSALTAPTASLGWDEEASDFTIDFIYGGSSVEVSKKGADEVFKADLASDVNGVAFATNDTNALYRAVGHSDLVEGLTTEATAPVSVYGLVTEAIVNFAKTNPETLITELQLEKAVGVLNNGGIYVIVKDGKKTLTDETARLMTLDADNGTVTLNDVAYKAGLKFKNVKGYASSEAADVKTDGITVSEDGRTVTIEAIKTMEQDAVIYLEDVEFVLDADTEETAADETVSGELDFIEEI